MITEKSVGQKVVPCTIIGDGMVGKTSLALAFANRQPPQEPYVATVFDNYAGNVSVHGEQYTVKIFDSPGQHDYEDVRAFSYRDSEAIVVCYSVADPDSYQNVKDVWIQETRANIKKKKPIVLIGCQSDVRKTKPVCESVTTKQGLGLAKDIGADAFLECSSQTLEGVLETFQTVVHLALKNRKKKSKIFSRLLRK